MHVHATAAAHLPKAACQGLRHVCQGLCLPRALAADSKPPLAHCVNTCCAIYITLSLCMLHTLDAPRRASLPMQHANLRHACATTVYDADECAA